MNKQKKRGLVAMIISVVVIAVVLYIDLSDNEPAGDIAQDTTATSTPSAYLEDIVIQGPEGAIIEVVEVTMPDLNRPIEFKGVMADNAEVQQLMTEKIDTVIASIQESGGTLNEWLDLGIYWKQVDDYEGAALAWEYASALRPSNHVSFTNLGNLYHLYLKDYKKAEENFLTAIANKPDHIIGYLELHSLYRDSYTEKSDLADDILQQGLLANPGNEELEAALVLYNKTK
jgi:tetratricopeptide (TPR) repeat protein